MPTLRKHDMRHHYVPKFLLKAWSSTTNDEKVEGFRTDLPNAPSKRWAPKATGYEDNLYALSQPSVAGVNKQDVETGPLQTLDSNAARVLEKLHSSGLSCLTHDDLRFWVYFVMSLKIRTPDAVNLIRTEGSAYLASSLNDKPEEYDAISDVSDPSTLTRWTEKHMPGLLDNFGVLSIDKLIFNQKVAVELLRMTWWIWNFEGQKNHLLLSDRPCIFTTNWDGPDLVVALPIGPRKAFMMTKGERVANIMKSQRRRDLLTRINESSLNQAKSRIYARDRSPHRFICNRLAKRLSDHDLNDHHNS